MPWWMLPSARAETSVHPPPAPAPADTFLQQCVLERAPATLVATADSTALHARMTQLGGDRLELLVTDPVASSTFGPLASVVLIVLRGDRAHVISGRVDGPMRPAARGRVLGISLKPVVLRADARRSFRLPVVTEAQLTGTLRDARGDTHVLVPLNLSEQGAGGLLTDVRERGLAPGTEATLALTHGTTTATVRVQVISRSLATADRPATCGLHFIEAPPADFSVLLAHTEAAWLGGSEV